MPRPTKTNTLLNELAKVSGPGKKRGPKPKPNRPKLPAKKRQSAKQNKNRKVEETTNLAHITKAIVREGGTVPDIGVILGCAASEGSGEWLDRLKAEGLSLAEFLEIAKQRADIELVRIATKTALGYEYKEEKQETTAEYDEMGQPTGKFLPGKKTITKKRERDTGLLKFLLTSRMPEYFRETKHIEINKRVVEIKADARDEIRGFCAGVLKAFDDGVIDAEFVETVGETER